MIGYDARMALSPCRGMGLYLRELIRGRENQLLGFCASGEQDPELHPCAAGYRFFPAWEQFSLPRQLRRNAVSTFLAPYNTAPLNLGRGARLALVVHDLIFLASRRELHLSRSPYQNFGRLYRRFVVPRAVRRADWIVAVSEATRQELVERLGVAGERVFVIPNSADRSWFTLPVRDVAERKPALLCISGEAPSKNLERALQALALLEQRSALPPGFTLWIAGVSAAHHSYFATRAHAAGVRSPIEWLSFLSLTQLQERMQSAAIAFVPSLLEGFGRPVLEAMAAGTPCVAASIPSLKEVGGAAARYCSPHEAPAMADALAEVLFDQPKRRAMQLAGFAQAALFHPDALHPRRERFWAAIEGAA